VLAVNPREISAGASVVFVVTSVTHSVGVLSISGSLEDPLCAPPAPPAPPAPEAAKEDKKRKKKKERRAETA
jgi:hypothetical protein